MAPYAVLYYAVETGRWTGWCWAYHPNGHPDSDSETGTFPRGFTKLVCQTLMTGMFPDIEVRESSKIDAS